VHGLCLDGERAPERVHHEKQPICCRKASYTSGASILTVAFESRTTLRFECVTDVRLDQLRDVASGLKYCHDGKIFHGDIHWVRRAILDPSHSYSLICLSLQNNILINDIGRAMLTDFGTVVVGEFTKSKLITTQTAAGMERWTAPEILDLDPFNPRLSRKNAAVDVFAFGRMCLSVSTPCPDT
jgi:serine/threonine protein kinase